MVKEFFEHQKWERKTERTEIWVYTIDWPSHEFFKYHIWKLKQIIILSDT